MSWWRRRRSTVNLRRTNSWRDERGPVDGGWAQRASTGVLLVLGVGVAFWLTTEVASASGRALQLALLGADLVAVPLVIRRPIVLVLAVSVITTIGWVTGTTQEPFILAAWAIYLAAATGSRRGITRILLPGAIVVLGFAALSVGVPNDRYGILLILVSVTFVIGGWILGGRDRREAALREKAASARNRAALLEERAQVSRELHDILSHTLSRIGLRAAITVEVAPDDVERLRRALGTVETDSRAALAEVRAMLVAVREGSEPGSVSVAGVPDLVRDAAALGADIELDLRIGRPLPESVDVEGYRIVRELVTNIVRHSAQSHAVIRVLAHDDVLEICSENATGMSTDVVPGIGLRGIEERVRSLGGEFRLAPRDPLDRFRVAVRIPLSGPPR